MKKIVQSIAHLTFRTKLIIIISVGVTLFAIGFLLFTSEPTYAVKGSQLYAIKGNKAKLIGNYSEYYSSVTLENKEEVIIKEINWGDKETLFIINGEEHRVGPNGIMRVEGNLIILTDNSKRKKKVDQYGNLVR